MNNELNQAVNAIKKHIQTIISMLLRYVFNRYAEEFKEMTLQKFPDLRPREISANPNRDYYFDRYKSLIIDCCFRLDGVIPESYLLSPDEYTAKQIDWEITMQKEKLLKECMQYVEVEEIKEPGHRVPLLRFSLQLLVPKDNEF